MPSGNVEKVHVPVVDEATKVHATDDPDAGVAVTSTEAPDIKPDTEISGVLSEVILSELDEPRSEDVASVGAPAETIHFAYKVTDPLAA